MNLVWRALDSTWGMRVVAVACIGLEIWIISGGRWFDWIIGSVGIATIGFCWYSQEVQMRRRRQAVWDMAARTSDPIGWLARYDFFRNLPLREAMTFAKWVGDHPDQFIREHFDEAPEVVQRYFLQIADPPKEL